LMQAGWAESSQELNAKNWVRKVGSSAPTSNVF
jgi:hypothetical protein